MKLNILRVYLHLHIRQAGSIQDKLKAINALLVHYSGNSWGMPFMPKECATDVCFPKR